MWNLLALLAAISMSLVIIRRLRLVREARERAQSIELVEAAFLETSQQFTLPRAKNLVKTIQSAKQLRRKYLQPELQRLERALSSASKWTGASDPEDDRSAIFNGVAHLYVKWRDCRPSLE